MKAKNPALVTVIGDFNILYIFFIIISFLKVPKFNGNLDLSFINIQSFSEGIIRVLEVVSLSIITYGFLKLKKWGYWLMVTYYLFLLIVAIISILSHNKLYAAFIIPALFALNLIFPSKRYFIKENRLS